MGIIERNVHCSIIGANADSELFLSASRRRRSSCQEGSAMGVVEVREGTNLRSFNFLIDSDAQLLN